MPYFNNDQINILFIHIPKTGGTSLEMFFSKKYNISLNNKSLFGINKLFNTTLQHLNYSTIIKNNKLLNINLNNLIIISIVRNPYDRLISDLYYYNLINDTLTTDQIYIILTNYFNSNNDYDGHKIQQYKFITINDKIIDNIIILKTEKLNDNMHEIGYTDFNLKLNANKNNKKNFYEIFNSNSIKLINNYYDKDFILFNYTKINPFITKSIFSKKNINFSKKNIKIKYIFSL